MATCCIHRHSRSSLLQILYHPKQLFLYSSCQNGLHLQSRICPSANQGTRRGSKMKKRKPVPICLAFWLQLQSWLGQNTFSMLMTSKSITSYIFQTFITIPQKHKQHFRDKFSLLISFHTLVRCLTSWNQLVEAARYKTCSISKLFP